MNMCGSCRQEIPKTRHPAAKYCNATCQRREQRRRARTRGRTNNLPYATSETKKCLHCGSEFIKPGNVFVKKYCSIQCRRAAQKKRQYSVSPAIGNCLVCNDEFPTTTTNTRKKYCSIECCRKAEYARRGHRRKKPQIEMFDLRDITPCTHCGSLGDKYPGVSRICKECVKHNKREYEAKRREKDPEWHQKQLGRLRQWKKDNPEKIKLKNSKRKDDGVLRWSQWNTILEVFNHSCAYCDRDDVPLEKDHVVPYALGGKLEFGNVIPACNNCNLTKSTRDLRDFINDEQRYEAIIMLMGEAEYQCQNQF